MNRRTTVAFAAALMGAAFAGSIAWRPTRRLADNHPKVDLESLFPKGFADWRIDERVPVQLISPDTQALLNKIYNQTLSRTYVNGRGDRIMLSVAYGGDQSDGTRAHRPEICYPAQGFQILNASESHLARPGGMLRVRRLVTRLGSRNEPLTYWVTVGEKITLSGTEQKLAQLSYTMRGLVPDGMLVRVSSIDPSPQAAFDLQASFVKDLALVLPPEARAQIMGKDFG